MNVKKKISSNLIYVIIVFLFSLTVTSTIFTNVYDKPFGNNIVNNFNKIFDEHEKNFTALQNYKSNNDICEYVRNEKLHRHSLRWVGEYLKIKFIKKINSLNIGHKASFFLYLLIVALMISLIFFLFSYEINKKNNYKFLGFHNFHLLTFYFLFILFFLTKPLGELRFSIFEFFFISLSLFFCIKKKYLPYLLSVLICLFNRESGIITSTFWFLINMNYSKNYLNFLRDKKFLFLSLFTPFLCLFSLIYLNWDVLVCVNNNTFLIPGVMAEKVSEVKTFLDFSTLHHVFSNYILIIILLIIFYRKANLPLLIISIIYLLTFYFFTPLNQYEIRILLLPILMFYIFLK
jgi:hypothetical protein